MMNDEPVKIEMTYGHKKVKDAYGKHKFLPCIVLKPKDKIAYEWTSSQVCDDEGSADLACAAFMALVHIAKSAQG